MLLEADNHVVNCLQPHPYDPSEQKKKKFKRTIKGFILDDLDNIWSDIVFLQFLLHLELTMTLNCGRL